MVVDVIDNYLQTDEKSKLSEVEGQKSLFLKIG